MIVVITWWWDLSLETPYIGRAVAAAAQRFSLFLHRDGSLTFNTAVFGPKKISVKHSTLRFLCQKIRVKFFLLQRSRSLALNVAVVLLPEVLSSPGQKWWWFQFLSIFGPNPKLSSCKLWDASTQLLTISSTYGYKDVMIMTKLFVIMMNLMSSSPSSSSSTTI